MFCNPSSYKLASMPEHSCLGLIHTVHAQIKELGRLLCRPTIQHDQLKGLVGPWLNRPRCLVKCEPEKRSMPFLFPRLVRRIDMLPVEQAGHLRAPRRCASTIDQSSTDHREEKRAEAPLGPVDFKPWEHTDQLGKDFLREVLCVWCAQPLPPSIEIDDTPIPPKKLGPGIGPAFLANPVNQGGCFACKQGPTSPVDSRPAAKSDTMLKISSSFAMSRSSQHDQGHPHEEFEN